MTLLNNSKKGGIWRTTLFLIASLCNFVPFYITDACFFLLFSFLSNLEFLKIVSGFKGKFQTSFHKVKSSFSTMAIL